MIQLCLLLSKYTESAMETYIVLPLFYAISPQVLNTSSTLKYLLFPVQVTSFSTHVIAQTLL